MIESVIMVSQTALAIAANGENCDLVESTIGSLVASYLDGEENLVGRRVDSAK